MYIEVYIFVFLCSYRTPHGISTYKEFQYVSFHFILKNKTILSRRCYPHFREKESRPQIKFRPQQYGAGQG